MLSRLHEAAEAQGLYFPLWFGARGSAMIGGVLSTNAGGSNVLRYGMMRTLVLGLEAVLPDGRIVTGKTSPLLGACSAMLLDALKALAGIDDAVKLLAPEAIEPIQELKTRHLGSRNPRLHTDEVLIALAVSANADPHAKRALAELQHLRGCDAHSSVILGSVDSGILRNLGVLVTSEPVYQTKNLYRKR